MMLMQHHGQQPPCSQEMFVFLVDSNPQRALLGPPGLGDQSPGLVLRALGGCRPGNRPHGTVPPRCT